MKTIEGKKEKEKRIVGEMIKLYCRTNHKKRELCDECKLLKEYAEMRSDKCPFTETKTFCSNCKVHCYKAEMREKIRQVMRFSGPRMIMYHPVMAVSHLIESKNERRKLEKENES